MVGTSLFYCRDHSRDIRFHGNRRGSNDNRARFILHFPGIVYPDADFQLHGKRGTLAPFESPAMDFSVERVRIKRIAYNSE